MRATKSKVRDVAVGVATGIVGYPIATYVTYEAAFRGRVLSSYPFTILICGMYAVVAVAYSLVILRRRAYGLPALAAHVLVWAWVPIEILMGLPI